MTNITTSNLLDSDIIISQGCLIRPHATSSNVLFVFSAVDIPSGKFLGTSLFTSEIFDATIIFLNTGVKQWYLNGIDGLGDSIAKTAETLKDLQAKYLKPGGLTIAFGNSMGAYGALLYGCLLNVELVAAPGLEGLLKNPLGISRSFVKNVKKIPNIYRIVANSKTKCHFMCGEEFISDVVGNLKLNTLPNIFCQSVINCPHGVSPYLFYRIMKYNDYLKALIKMLPSGDLKIEFPAEGNLLKEPKLAASLYKFFLMARKNSLKTLELVPELLTLAEESSYPINKSYALYAVAQLYYSLERDDEALQKALAAVEFNPESLPINGLLADIYYKRPDYHKAANYGVKSVSPAGERWLNVGGPERFIQNTISLGKIKSPLKVQYEAAQLGLRHHPENQTLLFQAAINLLNMNKISEAAAEFEKCNELGPHQPACNCLAKIYIEAKDYEKAELFINKALAIDNKASNFVAYYFQALLKYEKGDLQAARQALEHSLRLQPIYTPSKKLAELLAGSSAAQDPTVQERVTENDLKGEQEKDSNEFNFHDQLKFIFNDVPNFSAAYYQSIAASFYPPVINKGPAMFMADVTFPLVNIKDGMRKTIGSPDDYENTVYLLGDSRLSGFWCEDADTVNSHLQAICNNNSRKLKVVNYGCPKGSLDVVFLQLQTLDLKAGDYLATVQGPIISNLYSNFNHYALAIQKYCRERQVDFMCFNMLSLPFITPWSEQEKRMIIADRLNRKVVPDLPPPASIEDTKKRYLEAIDNLKALGCPITDLSPLFQRPHDMGEIFVDGGGHFTHRGNKRVAETIYKNFIAPCESYRAGEKPDVNILAIQKFAKIVREQNQEAGDIRKWFSQVPKPDLPQTATVGSIVMNCNPFTYGHQYLIESAAAKVDFLYIFVVEEDKSDFPFKDRFKLVQEGTKHLGAKVAVVASGKFIISSFSFKEYFRKDKITEKIDPTNDVAIYGALIAPELKIKYRFVGEEPHCNVTNQYNETMLRLLPSMGVNVIVIPRKTEGEKVISASSVRKYLSAGDSEAVKKIVPPTTYDYLIATGRLKV